MANTLVVGVGDWKTSHSSEDEIKTYALGSCVAVIMLDPKIRAGGMAHIALPDSKINPDKGKLSPCYFADTGLPKLLDEMRRMGSTPSSGYIVKIAGGAKVIDQADRFDIGQRNINAIKKILWANNLIISAEDVGKDYSRTVTLNMQTGKLVISSANGQKWSL